MAVAEGRIIIGLDYGTTYSGVAYTLVGGSEHDINVNARGDGHAGATIVDVTSWAREGAPKVPSVVSYSPSEAREANWGYETSDTAVEMIWTKLQLEEQTRIEELELVLKALDGMANLDIRRIEGSRGLPSYPAKEPVQVVTDYLSFLRTHLVDVDLEGPEATIGRPLLRRTPIDIVLTCPIEWSDEAKAKTFQAITNAGFNKSFFPNLNEIVLTSEPEAAALFVLESIQQDEDRTVLRVGDCIVHCDAGGGTVDVGSFRVKQIVPDLVLEDICLGAGKKCGATFVDLAFLSLLKRKMGSRHFQTLTKGMVETSIGSHTAWNADLSKMMKTWERVKRDFAGEEAYEQFINLPLSLTTLHLPEHGIIEGQLRINGHDLREAFRFSVDSTISLIAGQVGQCERLGSRVKFVALSGGFACSDYLYNEISDEIFRTRRIPTRRPADKYQCWPAVARGAVLYGLQHDTSQFVFMRQCRMNYGLRTSQPFSAFKHSGGNTYQDPFDGDTKVGNEMVWLAKTGDLILSNKGHYSSVQICRRFGLNDNRNFPTALLANDDKEAPAAHLYNEMHEAAKLTYDLSSIPDSEFDRLRTSNGRRPYYHATLTFHLMIKDEVQFWVTFGKRELARVAVPYI